MPLADGLIIAAPRSGSGKTTLTLGLLAALRSRGIAVAPAKTGPDYIDTAILSRAAGREAINLDPWAMRPARLAQLASDHADGADLLLIEGVMGLFDGAADGTGSTGDLAATLGLPVILVVEAERQGQSIAPLVAGFAHWRPEVKVAGLIVNRAASTRHEAMLRAALARTGIPVLGVIPRRDNLALPDRHLGLVLPDEIAHFDAVVAAAAAAVGEYVDLNVLLALSRELSPSPALWAPSPARGEGDGAESSRSAPSPLVGEGGAQRRMRGFKAREDRGDSCLALPPLGQRIAIARDDAFAFLYPHWLGDWRGQGAELSVFSPLADEAPDPSADAVFLPGGYPELHGARLAAASSFKAGLIAARDRGALIYGECGGFMVLGETLTDRSGTTHQMAGLLPVATRIDRPKRTLGYRRLSHASPLPWPPALNGHEFHYSSARQTRTTPLFSATDALGEALPPMGAVDGRVMGSYAHVIDVCWGTEVKAPSPGLLRNPTSPPRER
ncbi:MAG: cobyrinate a,c-diamide synthase [Devosia sp.]